MDIVHYETGKINLNIPKTCLAAQSSYEVYFRRTKRKKFMERSGLITLEFVNTVIRERPRDIHKGQCGRALIVAGSMGMAGAAVLSAGGALRSGAGLVRIAAPREIMGILQTAVPEATCMDVRDISLPDMEIYGAAAVGPGLGVDEDSYLITEKILRGYSGPVVIDADGLNALCAFGTDWDMLKERKCPVILTPHQGEADRLLTAMGEGSVSELGREKAAVRISERIGAAVLLKGADTVVTMKGRGTYINTTGNPGMATGGSGDVLTGVIAAIAASGAEAFDAVRAGAFIHGMAGDIAADRLGQWGMVSSDIVEALPEAFKKVTGK